MNFGISKTCLAMGLSVALGTCAFVLPTAALAWDAPTEVGPGEGFLRLLDDGKGRTVAVFLEYDGSYARLRAAMRPKGAATFGAPAWISPSSSSNASSPDAATSRKGHVAVSWTRYDGADYVVETADSGPKATSFAAPLAVSPTGVDGDVSKVAIDSKGNSTVIWERQNAGYQITASTRPAGGIFSAPQTLASSSVWPFLAMDGKGNLLASWHNYGTPNTTIEASIKPVGGAFTAAQTVSDPMSPSYAPVAAYDRKGNAIVLFTFGQAVTLPAKSTTFSAPFATGVTGTPSVEFDKSGNLFAAWTEFAGTISFAVRPAGGAFGSPVTLSTPMLTAYGPDLAVDKKGNVRVVWIESDGVRNRVKTALRTPDGVFGATETLSSAGVNASIPSVSFDRKGNATVAWVEDNGAGSNYRVMVTNQPR